MLEVAMRKNADLAQLNHTLGPYMGGGAVNMSGQIDSLVKLSEYIIYGSIGAFGLVCQGSMAFYYARRERLLKAYLAQTPDWIVQIQQAQRMPGEPRAPLRAFRI
jgi:hypothetical protein